MDDPLLIPLLFCVGVLAGFLANRLPLSNVMAFLFTLVPVAGFGLTMVFCWGHPLTPLGPSVMVASSPFALGYAIHACRNGGMAWLGILAAVVAAFESLIVLMILGASCLKYLSGSTF